MRRKSLLTAVLTSALLCMMVTPAWAGEWVEEGSTWKYYADSGSAMTGWLEDNESWYYFLASGNMATGWVKDDGSWYFLHDDGTMAHDTWIDNYYVNASGKWVKTR